MTVAQSEVLYCRGGPHYCGGGGVDAEGDEDDDDGGDGDDGENDGRRGFSALLSPTAPNLVLRIEVVKIFWLLP